MSAITERPREAPPAPDRAELFGRATGDDLAHEFGLERLLDLLRPEPEGREAEGKAPR